MKVGIIIATGGGEIYDRFHEAQKATWISRKPDNVIIDTHSGGDANTMAQRAIKTFGSMPECDVYMTTTSASYIDTVMMIGRLSFIDGDRFYYGGVLLGQDLPYIEWRGKFIPQTIVSGACLIMSRYAFELLAYNMPDYDLPDDVLIGRTFSWLGLGANFATERIDVKDTIPEGKAWHYRFHTDNREQDIQNMHLIHKLHEDRAYSKYL